MESDPADKSQICWAPREVTTDLAGPGPPTGQAVKSLDSWADLYEESVQFLRTIAQL